MIVECWVRDESYICCAACGTRLDTDSAIRLHRCETAPLLARIAVLEGERDAAIASYERLRAAGATCCKSMRDQLEAAQSTSLAGYAEELKRTRMDYLQDSNDSLPAFENGHLAGWNDALDALLAYAKLTAPPQ